MSRTRFAVNLQAAVSDFDRALSVDPTESFKKGDGHYGLRA